MTDEPRAALHDLLTEVPAHVVSGDLAAAAWAAGARRRSRRRSRRRLGTAAATVAVLLLAGLALTGWPGVPAVAPAATPEGGVAGYPLRLEYPYRTRDLPDDPGPVAGLVHRTQEGFGRESGWYAISPRGRMWRVPTRADDDTYPVLSADGRMLAYLADDLLFEIHDLVAGTRVRFPQVSRGRTVDGVPVVDAEWWVAGQSPGFWSPDGGTLLVRGGRTGAGDRTDAMLLRPDGSVTPLEVDARLRHAPAGWTADGAIAWVPFRDDDSTTDRPVLVTDVGGQVIRRLPIEPSAGRISQWSGQVSPDGRRVALALELDSLDAVRVEVFSLADGTRLDTELTVKGAVAGCSPVWAGDRVVVPTRPDGWRHRVLEGPSEESVVIADHRLRTYCSLWASEALAGTSHRGVAGTLFGRWPKTVSWWWRELVAAAMVLGGGLAGAVVARRRRRALSGR